jgi:hypothetical protein
LALDGRVDHQSDVAVLPSGRRVPDKSKTVLRVVTVLGFAVPVVAYFWVIHHYGVNAIWYDQWDDINVIAHPTLTNLWAQHNEDRIFFPNLVVLALAHTIHFNIHVEDYLSGLMLVAAVGLIIAAHKRRSPSTPWLYYCPVAIIMFSFVQVGNSLFGFQLAWFMVMLSLAGALFLLDRPLLNWSVLTGAMALAVIGSFSSLQGLLIWPVGLVLLYSRSRTKSMIIAWIAVGIVSAIVYFHHLSSAVAGTGGSYAFNHPVLAMEFFFSAIGDIVGQQIPAYGRNDWVIVLGVVIVAVAAWTLIVYGFRRENSSRPIGVALICFGLLFAGTIAVGRLDYGLYYSDASRYTTFDLLILVGCYLTVLQGRTLRATTRPTTEVERPGLPTRRFVDLSVHIVRAIIALTILLLVVLGTANGLAQARVWNQKLVEASKVTVNIDKAPDNVVSGVLYPLPISAVGFVRHMARIAKTQDLSVFATSTAAQYAKAGLPAETHITTKMDVPANGVVVKGFIWLGASASVDIGPIPLEVSRLDFLIIGPDAKRITVGPAGFTEYGWLAVWNTNPVPNGSYAIQSVVYNSAGKPTRSASVSVTVNNP